MAAATLAVLVPALLLLAGRGGPAAAAGAAASIEFVFTAGFAPQNVTTTGAAVVTASGLLQLTNETNEVFGHGFYPVPVRLKDASPTGAPLSFSTTFVFAILPRYPDAHGHGIAFALAPSPAVPGAVPGKCLGLFNASDNMGQGRSQVVAVELDTARDAEFSDVDGNHVGVDVNSLVSGASAPAAFIDDVAGSLVNFSLVSGDLQQVWIEYDGASMRLEVTVVSPAGKPRPSVPLVSYTVNLSTAVADDTFIGFSGANGAASSSHYVLGWSFRLGGGRAPDLDLSKLPSLPARFPSKKTMPTLQIVILFLVAVLVLLLLSVAAAVLVNRRRRFAEEQEEWEIEYGPHRIRYRDLHAATRGFRDVIGAGGFGTVFHGVLPRSGGAEVAVKKVSHESRQGLREFVSEIASMSRLRHRSLVQLLGYCRRRGELILVYDYMANGSLDKHLFGAAGAELGAARQDRPRRRRRAAVPARGVGAGGGAPRHQVRQRAPRRRHERQAQRLRPGAALRPRRRLADDARDRDAGVPGAGDEQDGQGHHKHRRVRVRRLPARGCLRPEAHGARRRPRLAGARRPRPGAVEGREDQGRRRPKDWQVRRGRSRAGAQARAALLAP